MKQRSRMKKIISKFLVVAMTLSVFTGADMGKVMTVNAAGTGQAPSITTFATAQQLESSFDLNGDDTDNVTNIGKVYFGTNGENDRSWYIAGTDMPGSIVLLCDFYMSMGHDEVFENDEKNKKAYSDYKDTWGCNYITPLADDAKLHQSHYGASDMRLVILKEHERDFFTAEERALMLDTILYTYDGYNDSVYSTTDKLYIPYGVYGDKYVTVGSNSADNLQGGLKVSLTSGPYSDPADTSWMKLFWLRVPYQNTSECNMGVAFLLGFVDGATVNSKGMDTVPAFRLNLSSVLFASAAPSSTADASLKDAMTFRLNGESVLSSKAYYDAYGVSVDYNDTDAIYLYVQGNDGTNDWVYSKEITADSKISTDTVLAGAKGTGGSVTLSEVDLSSCKIWIEKTGQSSNLTYAKLAGENSIISSVAVTDITEPEGNQVFDTEGNCTTTGVTASGVTWEKKIGQGTDVTYTTVNGNAEYNTCYRASVTLKPDLGYQFSDAITADNITVNGVAVTEITKNTDGSIKVSYEVTSDKDILSAIKQDNTLVGIANGTALTEMNLPATVEVYTVGGTTTNAAVNWNLNHPIYLDGTSYNPSVLSEQTFVLQGIVTCPDDIEDGGVELTTKITVTVSEAGVVGIPTGDIASGTYTENQKVTLTSSTEGARIYYTITTDGTEPAIPDEGSNLYTKAIDVNGQEGTSVVVKIKAIAVQSGLKDSAVAEFQYVINIPKKEPEQTAPVFTSHPVDVTVAEGETASFQVAVTGNPTPNLQWQINKNDKQGWQDIAGATGTSYTTEAVTTTADGYQYRCVATNSKGSVISNVAVLTVKDITITETLYVIDYNQNYSGAQALTEHMFKDGDKGILYQLQDSRAGYDFTGWNTAKDGSGINFAGGDDWTKVRDKATWIQEDATIKSVTLYAQWTPVENKDSDTDTDKNTDTDTDKDNIMEDADDTYVDNNISPDGVPEGAPDKDNNMNPEPGNGNNNANSDSNQNTADEKTVGIFKTGDAGQIYFWIVLMIISGIGVVYLGHKKRKRSE